jgi:hypothetical protein
MKGKLCSKSFYKKEPRHSGLATHFDAIRVSWLFPERCRSSKGRMTSIVEMVNRPAGSGVHAAKAVI